MKSRPFLYSKVLLCRDCGGTGYLTPEYDQVVGDICPTCSGSGRVKRTVNGTVTVEPY